MIAFLKSYLFLIGGWLFYNIVWDSAIQLHESAIGIHMSPPCWSSLTPPTPPHPYTLAQSTRFELPATYYASKKQISGCWGPDVGDETSCKGAPAFQGDQNVLYLSCSDGFMAYIADKTLKTVHLKWVKFTICKQ